MNIDSCIPAAPKQPDNPTDEERHILLRYALFQDGRQEDFQYIRDLTAPPQDITTIINPGELSGIRIGIIGAGLAGLSAAYELRKTGAEITIFEAEENRIGGRVYTHYFDQERLLHGELGAMRIPVSHETVWHYINLFKLPVRPFVQTNENAFIFLRNRRVRNDPEGKNLMMNIYPEYNLTEMEKRTPWQRLEYIGLQAPLLPASPEQRSEVLQVKPCYNTFVNYWDFQSNRKIREAIGLSQGAINMLSSLSPTAGRNLYNSYVDIAQAEYAVTLSFLYELNEGTAALPYAIYNSLINPNPIGHYTFMSSQYLGRVTVKSGNWITGIHREDKTGRVILAYCSKSADCPMHESFDFIVCAIPFSILRTVHINPLFSEIKMQAIREVNYIASQKTIMLCSRRFWEEGGEGEQIIGGGSYTDLPISTIWYPSDHARYCNIQNKFWMQSFPYSSLTIPQAHQNVLAAEPGVLLASYNDNLDAIRLAGMTPELRLEEIKNEVEAVHGLPEGYLDSIVTDSKTMNWNINPWSRGALTFFSPEQKRLFSYGMALPEYDNRVFMAGDHISAVHRWMQGALHSGMTAANQLASVFKNKAYR